MGLTDEPFDLIERLASPGALAAMGASTAGGGSSPPTPCSPELLTLFFLALWKRSNGVSRPAPSIAARIPDSVILHHSRPILWFFTARDGSLKIRSKKHMTTEAIITTMAKHAKSVSGCTTQFVTHCETSPDGVDISFQTATELPVFVSANSRPGLLQQYIDPKEERGLLCNTEIVPTWTPNVFYVERRINASRLSDPHVPLSERCSASETCRYVSTVPLVSTHTIKCLESLCQEVAMHIDSVFRCRVSSITLHVKVNAADEAVIQRCSSLRLVSGGAEGGICRSVTCSLVSGTGSHVAATSPQKNPVKHGTTRSPSPRRQVGSAMETTDEGASSQAPKSRPLEDECACRLCLRTVPDKRELLSVPQRHVLLPLSLLTAGEVAEPPFRSKSVQSRTSASPPRPVSQTPSPSPSSSKNAPPVAEADLPIPPAHVRMLHPTLTWEAYERVRDTEEFDGQLVSLCQRCSDALTNAIARMRVDSYGAAILPRFAKATKRVAPPVTAAGTPPRSDVASPPKAETASPAKPAAAPLPPINNTLVKPHAVSSPTNPSSPSPKKPYRSPYS